MDAKLGKTGEKQKSWTDLYFAFPQPILPGSGKKTVVGRKKSVPGFDFHRNLSPVQIVLIFSTDMDSIVQILKENIPDLQAVYLFGSRAEGLARPESDTDIAYLAEGVALSAVDRFFLAQKLANVLHTDVDLIDLKKASTVLRFEIVGKGKRIFCPDEYACDLFEATVFSMYQRLQEERAGIIAEIMRKGRVYG